MITDEMVVVADYAYHDMKRGNDITKLCAALAAVAPMIAAVERARCVALIEQGATMFRIANADILGADTTASLLVHMFADALVKEVSDGN